MSVWVARCGTFERVTTVEMRDFETEMRHLGSEGVISADMGTEEELLRTDPRVFLLTALVAGLIGWC